MIIDPVSLEVARNALTAIAEEMSMVVMRAARSPLLREAGDHSSALTDAAGFLIAQGQDVPVHLGVLSFTVREFLAVVRPAEMRPGDVWIVNTPEVGGNHLPDVKLIRPVFSGTTLYAFAISLAHWADIGGAAPGSYYAAAVDAWQEGLRIPPVRLVAGEAIDERVMAFILANVRGPEERRGDILAQIAATTVAARRLAELDRRYGAPFLVEAFEAIHARAERQMRAAIAALPDGVYRGEDFMDDDGHGGPPQPIRVTATIAGDEITFDFSDSADAVPGPINTTPFIAGAAAFYVMKALFGPEIQPSAGCYRPLRIVTRPGSILDGGATAPVVGGNHETCQRVADAIFQAFRPFAVERMSAGGPTTAGLLIFGARRDDGSWSTFYEVHCGGEGARADRDGMAATRVHLANVMNTPAEVIESEYPITVEFQRLRRGSGGRGRHAGGDGVCRGYRVQADGVSLTTMFERAVVPPYGLEGGEDGAPFRVRLERSSGETLALAGKANIVVGAGDLVVAESCGGGGYGRSSD
ncbi:hydantoinase B/oxoprolinase family protein [Methylobacterium terricola]|uniref:Hydantoinase B/oxoprolinase family protein n=1 Tax=Methylobacterium terricola TaxID=2583531 RepID=A0A5C4LAU2_9HYPH|nr:hydantoinase B/oxoprolinase family protein [Methylobacterium terricola]TNC08186.1 hydantoinase B/oxoprolinase family protein [Methylobacterium terricola]